MITRYEGKDFLIEHKLFSVLNDNSGYTGWRFSIINDNWGNRGRICPVKNNSDNREIRFLVINDNSGYRKQMFPSITQVIQKLFQS